MEAIKLLLNLLLTSVRTHLQRARESATLGASAAEYILVVLGRIVIAGLVVAAVTAFVRGKTSELG